jgi:probable HAF family extracellular repeat protein
VDINGQGQVIGNSPTAAGQEHAYLWANGVMTDLGTLGGDVTTVKDINDRGQIVGYSQAPDGRYHAFLWENGVMADLNLSPAPYYSEAAAINENGQVAGTYRLIGGQAAGFLWQNGLVIELSDERWDLLRLDGLNANGQIVGYRGDSSSARAFLWSAGRLRDLDAPELGAACPAVINDAGVIALALAGGENGAGPPRAAIWSGGVFIPLSTLGGEYPSCANAINNAGRLAGQSSPGLGVIHAVLWEIVE